jgi:predicted ATPase/DNA-binding SARP family transcriptional activator
MTTFAVLGPLVVTGADGSDVTPPGDLQRRLLSMLLLRRGSVVSTDRLVEAMWGDGAAPGSAALHSHVSRLRKRIAGLGLEFTGGGYRLDVSADALDAVRFESAVSEAVAVARHDPESASRMLDEALGWWRGRPYADLADDDDGLIEIERLSEIRTRALEERLGTLIAVGRSPDAVADLEALVAREPLRERPRVLLMDALSTSGRRAEALRVYDAYRLVLAEELGVSPSPAIRARHDELLALDDVDPESSRRRPVPTLPPRPISTLFGRDDELQALVERAASSRLVTLIGPGGVGKTRLALEAAHRLGSQFADGIAFCDLTRVPDAADAEGVGAAVCTTLRIEPRAGVPAADRIAEVLRADMMMLVLDNCEHVLDGTADLVERIMGTTQHLAVLATSRERLAIDGELLFPVLPLPCDREDGLAAARALFLDRAAAVGVGAPPDVAAVSDLCRRLDGLPLAIELAAARLHSLTLDEISDGLEESMGVLSGGRRTVSRHRSLDAALDWSHRLLTDELRDALAAAAVFAAPFEAVDVAAVLETPVSTTRDLLAELVDRSLVFRTGDRFRLLGTIRSFVRRQQPERRREGLRLAHAEHVARRITAIAAEFRCADGDRPIAMARHLAPDLHQALDISLAQRDADRAIGLVVSCRDLALDGMLPQLMTCGEAAGELGVEVAHPLTPDAFAIAALGRWKMNDLDDMRRLLDRAVAEAERSGIRDRYELAGALSTEAVAHGDFQRAVGHAESALRDPEVADNLHRLAEGRATLAIFRSYAHDERAFDDVDILLRDVEPRAGAAPRSWCWYAAGECVLDVDPGLARVRLERSVEYARASGATFVEGIAATSLASLAVRDGRVADAIGLYRWLLPHWLRAGVSVPFWTMARSVAMLLTTCGADEPAARLLGAVTGPGSGHDVGGDDDQRLREIEAVLRSRLGEQRFAALAAAGSGLDEAAVATEATAAFDRLG